MNLTPQAKIFWDKIPAGMQIKLLNNVYCTTCKKMVGVSKVEGSIEKKNLILRGICTSCLGPVARLIEG